MPKAKYAEGTDVPVTRSYEEIEALLERFGATAFGYMREGPQAIIVFRLHGRHYRFKVQQPAPGDYAKERKAVNQNATRPLYASEIQDRIDQETKRRWREMVLWIKSTLVAVAAGILTTEQAFQPFALLPDGHTVSEWLEPQIDQVYRTGQMPPLLPGLPARSDLAE